MSDQNQASQASSGSDRHGILTSLVSHWLSVSFYTLGGIPTDPSLTTSSHESILTAKFKFFIPQSLDFIHQVTSVGPEVCTGNASGATLHGIAILAVILSSLLWMMTNQAWRDCSLRAFLFH